MTVPAWAEALLSSALRQHGNDVRSLRRAIASMESVGTLYASQEQREARQHVIDGMKKRLAELSQASEPERAP